MSTEIDKNISDWRHDCTDYKNDFDFFLRLLKWPKITVKKKPKFSEILGTKVVQFWCYTKLVKTKNVPLNWYYSIFRMIQMIFDDENWLWKSDFDTFCLLAIFGHLTSLM